MNNQLKVFSSVITFVWLGLAQAFSRLSSDFENKKFHSVLRIPTLSQITYLVWLLIPYHTIFQLDGFVSEVHRRAAKQKVFCADPETNTWNEYTLVIFAWVMSLLVLFRSVYSCLLRDVNRSINLQFEHRRQANLKYSEASLGLPMKKKDKKVAFKLPATKVLSSAGLSHKSYQFMYIILGYRRQAAFAFICLALSVFLLPEPAKHAFTYSRVKFKEYSITSDNLISGMALFTGLELARSATLSIGSPDGECGMRMAMTRFVAFYGIFLSLLSSFALLQADDSLKLYIYKVFASCGSSKLGDSYFDIHIPNENIISTFLGSNMMKYTGCILRKDFNEEETLHALEEAVSLFSQVLGDCVTVLMFASLVVIPGVLSIIIG